MSNEMRKQLQEARTVLLAIEVFDPVAGFVVLTEIFLLLSFFKGGLFPGGGLDASSTTIKAVLQGVDWTRNDRRVSEITTTRQYKPQG